MIEEQNRWCEIDCEPKCRMPARWQYSEPHQVPMEVCSGHKENMQLNPHIWGGAFTRISETGPQTAIEEYPITDAELRP